MGRRIGIGCQDFEKIRVNNNFYIDKTNFISEWWESGDDVYNDFIRALLLDDVKAMNIYMNRVALEMFSYFDTGKNPSDAAPERFYHGFVLGLMVELSDRYALTSNRESGFGRYDTCRKEGPIEDGRIPCDLRAYQRTSTYMLEPKESEDNAMILEFKVQEAEEKELSDTVKDALRQIDEKSMRHFLRQRG